MDEKLNISQYNYDLPEERIAKFPLARREDSRLLVYKRGRISQNRFSELGAELPEGSMLVFNNTKVIRARLIFFKETGARIEIFCLEPHLPADYERAMAAKGECLWRCMVGNQKKWKPGYPLQINGLQAELLPHTLSGGEPVVRFRWDSDRSFGELLEELGRIPIPPYLCRESNPEDNVRYQTVYSRTEGSVAAPTAGLHFTRELIGALKTGGHPTAEVTLHVGAGTFLPVKSANAEEHTMHTEHFDVTLSDLRSVIAHLGGIIAVGTTTVRTLESLAALGERIIQRGGPDTETAVGQWEIYEIPKHRKCAQLLEAVAGYMEKEGLTRLHGSTMTMITPGYRFMVVDGMITNFHQPQSTLLLLVCAFIGEDWKRVYDHAMKNGFRFLSYGDSSLLLPERGTYSWL